MDSDKFRQFDWLRLERGAGTPERFNYRSEVGMYLCELIGNLSREALVVIGMNIRNYVTVTRLVSLGTVDRTLADPAEVFKPLLVSNANRFVIGHVHPSGHLVPSAPDLATDERIGLAAEVLGLDFLDDFIVCGDRYKSIIRRWKEDPDA